VTGAPPSTGSVSFALVVPLAASNGRVWHTLERQVTFEREQLEATDDEFDLELNVEVDGRPVSLEFSVPVAPLLTLNGDAELLISPPLVVDPTTDGGDALRDSDGRVDGRVIVEEDA
jgi:hypothetical protein